MRNWRSILGLKTKEEPPEVGPTKTDMIEQLRYELDRIPTEAEVQGLIEWMSTDVSDWLNENVRTYVNEKITEAEPVELKVNHAL